jgi:biopolymer transport protein ExbD
LKGFDIQAIEGATGGLSASAGKPRKTLADKPPVAPDFTPLVAMLLPLAAVCIALWLFATGIREQQTRLPVAEQAQPPMEAADAGLTLRLNQAGAVLFNGDEVPVENIKPLLLRELETLARAERPVTGPVVIQAHRDTPAGKVQELMRVCQDREVGIERFLLRVGQSSSPF